MMTSSRPRDAGGSFSSRRGHANQLSISDSSHHITETIGTLYGDDDDYSQGDRPMSFIASPYGGEQIMRHEPPSPEEHRLKLVRSISDQDGGMQDSSPPSVNGSQIKKSQTAPGRRPSQMNGNHEGNPSSPSSPLSPTLRDMRDEGSQFPLGTMNNPNDIALELSNLQALRRMSMDVSNSQDPDLLPFQNMSLMSVAPQGDDDEADPSRLLWVPAGVHPELAPTEFKNFLEKRVQSIKRRSGDSMLSVDGLDRSDSGGLRRQKSMLSRQIDNRGGRGADGYVDGAERLERKNSTSGQAQAAAELSLDELMNDPSRAVQKLALQDGNSDGTSEDKPILPAVPGTGLRRSTRTTYRKGGSLKDRHGGSVRDRPSFSKRIAARQTEEGGSDITNSPIEAPPGYGLNRVQSEPIAENYSRPSRSVRRQQPFNREQPTEAYGDYQGNQDPAPSRPTEFGRSATDDRPQSSSSTPPIAETSVIEEEPSDPQFADQHSRPFPARSSSQSNIAQSSQAIPQVPDEPPARSSRRPNYGQQIQQQQQQQQPQYQQAPQQPQHQPQRKTSTSQQPARDHQRLPSQTLNDIAQNPAPLPGFNSGRTDSLTFIPTLPAEEKKPEKKSKKESVSKPTGWKWFKSGDDKDKKKKEEEESKKSKAKAIVEKAHDNVRLDVLQTSIDNVKQKGRESLLLDRDTADSKLEEERRKESSRKSGDTKKEKDGIFSSFFGGKKKGDRDSGGRKSHARPHSPEPAPYKPMAPDVDYHWTRFPILEERAIYLQAMHPQIQVPMSPQQKRLQEEERKRREQEQREQEYLEQQQAQESMDRYNFEYHRGSESQYGDDQQQYDDGGMPHDSGDYPEDAEIYDYDHGGAKDRNGGDGHNRGYSDDRRRQQQQDERSDDMWTRVGKRVRVVVSRNHSPQPSERYGIHGEHELGDLPGRRNSDIRARPGVVTSSSSSTAAPDEMEEYEPTRLAEVPI
ncbi:hypothetical protein PG994_014694 [Apiospora phragmitis]|uniref:Uncharacterized protein n=1 Tax=Apiospora phragmitis TaxID=2905665 RepID=A0ABR1SUN4_9PEZI